ncbi:MAG TPA: xanthine dehydrogenase molybdopterin binding subunit [Tepidisphaeraceae bacterium]|jgi:xanthine dehydrogenase large subunit
MSYVGQSIPLDTAPGHVSGKSLFIDDLPPIHGELLVGFVGSPVAHGRIHSIDFGDAAKIPGVVGLYTHKDVPGHNKFGPVVHDEYLLAEEETHFIGHPIVLIAAENLDAIEATKRLIKVEIDPLPALFTVDEALAAESFIGPWREMGRGDVTTAFADAANTLEGVVEIGGQEHFYLENQACIVTPGEYGACVVHSSTQHTTEVQSLVAEVLGVPFNHVTCICKRMGGGFGGKETQAAQPAMMAAIVARHTGRAARFVYNKDDDMRFTGKRHPFKAIYRVAFDDEGNISGLDLTLHANGGCSTDLTLAIQERAMLHSDNAYFIPHKRIRARAVRTNLPSNTAFRGFGGPQGVAAMEAVIEDVAAHLGVDALDVRQRNCYGSAGKEGGERNVTHYGQIVGNNTLPRLFHQLRDECQYDARREEIARHNAHDKLTLRGLAMTPVKFGISFTRRTLNQANALVNIYVDGSVLVSTGATEMGQGVNTRIRQIVADELGVDYAKVRVTETNTDKNNNTSPTAASSGTDLNGNAAIVACTALRERLSGIAAKLLHDRDDGLMWEPTAVRFHRGVVYDVRRPSVKIDFQQVVCEAYSQRVSLGERGHYVTPGVDFNRDTGKGHPFYYYTMGTACAEVRIDRFTGELRVPRVDLIMDVGLPINPGIDRGQVIGGFIQGMGWCTTEELKYGPAGQLLSYSPTTYKIPNVSDVPEIFNVRMLDNPDNHMSIKRSKAVGEPPLMLGLCVWAAVKDALNRQAGGVVPFPLPATNEAIAMAMRPSAKGRLVPSPGMAGRGLG